jgi:SAM-dependent methyltransferase
LIRKFCELKPHTKVLEIGSGIGDLFRTLKYLGYNTDNYAIEPGVDAHPTLEMLGVNILKMSLNGESLTKIPQNTFDIVVMSHSLEHFNSMDISDILNGIFNSLKPGGYFLCEVPNANLIKYPDAGDRVVPHLAFFSIKSIKHFLTKVGFEINFLNACGNNQFSKKSPSDEYMQMLKDKGYFNYNISDNGRVKINIGYHNWLLEKTKQRKRRAFIRNIFIKVLSSTKLLSVVRKLRSPYIYDILNDSNFIYSEDREFIRVIAKKNETNILKYDIYSS